LDGRLTALLDHVVPLPARRVGEHLGFACIESREEAHVVRVVGHDEEIQRSVEFDPLARGGG